MEREIKKSRVVYTSKKRHSNVVLCYSPARQIYSGTGKMQAQKWIKLQRNNQIILVKSPSCDKRHAKVILLLLKEIYNPSLCSYRYKHLRKKFFFLLHWILRCIGFYIYTPYHHSHFIILSINSIICYFDLCFALRFYYNSVTNCNLL